ncbi:hypothetical protein P700755_002380 [Psychroflexus torquis ATCC 700755]|uniref:Uncharacterized protein n=1 Tax=Psychroflexus torquis (strain ATCC 700755 / CIP 106069 / ACAM 623) TaxID=313595 RepID=K4IF36_PSYTT|nr:hypothetical protein P700755_002380 [Psychroflexus torquis ATCC 700755]
MAWSVLIWKICGFPKDSLYLERFVLKHATANIHNRQVQAKKKPTAQKKEWRKRLTLFFIPSPLLTIQ